MLGLSAQCLGLFVADINQHVDGAAKRSVLGEQWSGVGAKSDSASIGPLGDGDGVAHHSPLLDRLRHRAIFMLNRIAAGAVQLPGDAPVVLAELRLTPRELDTGMVPIGNFASG